MMLTVRIIAGLHMAVYLGIIWYGWRSYRMLRKESWLYVGGGFILLLAYRVDRFITLLGAPSPLDDATSYSTVFSFIGGLLLLIGFVKIYGENRTLTEAMKHAPVGLRAGAQSTNYWLDAFRNIVKEEVAAVKEKE